MFTQTALKKQNEALNINAILIADDFQPCFETKKNPVMLTLNGKSLLELSLENLAVCNFKRIYVLTKNLEHQKEIEKAIQKFLNPFCDYSSDDSATAKTTHQTENTNNENIHTGSSNMSYVRSTESNSAENQSSGICENLEGDSIFFSHSENKSVLLNNSLNFCNLSLDIQNKPSSMCSTTNSIKSTNQSVTKENIDENGNKSISEINFLDFSYSSYFNFEMHSEKDKSQSEIADYQGNCYIHRYKYFLNLLVYIRGSTLGECMRNIDDATEDPFYLIYDALSFVYFPFMGLFEALKSKKVVFHSLLTTTENYTQSNTFSVLGLKKNNVVYYDRNTKETEGCDEGLFEAMEVNKKIHTRSDIQRSVICAVKKQFIALFTEHFEINSIDDMVEKIVAIKLYPYKFYVSIFDQQVFRAFLNLPTSIKDAENIDYRNSGDLVHLIHKNTLFDSKGFFRFFERQKRRSYRESEEDSESQDSENTESQESEIISIDTKYTDCCESSNDCESISENYIHLQIGTESSKNSEILIENLSITQKEDSETLNDEQNNTILKHVSVVSDNGTFSQTILLQESSKENLEPNISKFSKSKFSADNTDALENDNFEEDESNVQIVLTFEDDSSEGKNDVLDEANKNAVYEEGDVISQEVNNSHKKVEDESFNDEISHKPLEEVNECKLKGKSNEKAAFADSLIIKTSTSIINPNSNFLTQLIFEITNIATAIQQPLDFFTLLNHISESLFFSKIFNVYRLTNKQAISIYNALNLNYDSHNNSSHNIKSLDTLAKKTLLDITTKNTEQRSRSNSVNNSIPFEKSTIEFHTFTLAQNNSEDTYKSFVDICLEPKRSGLYLNPVDKIKTASNTVDGSMEIFQAAEQIKDNSNSYKFSPCNLNNPSIMKTAISSDSYFKKTQNRSDANPTTFACAQTVPLFYCKFFTSLDSSCFIKNSFIFPKNLARGRITDSIITENINVNEDVDQAIFNKQWCVSLHQEIVEEDEEEDNDICEDTYYQDVYEYLMESFIELLEDKIELPAISKQLNLFRIIWNANSSEMVEAFGSFIGHSVHFDTYEQNLISISTTFPILSGQTKDIEVQKSFIFKIHESLDIEDKVLKLDLAFRISLMLIEDGIVSREAVLATKLFDAYNL